MPLGRIWMTKSLSRLPLREGCFFRACHSNFCREAGKSRTVCFLGPHRMRSQQSTIGRPTGNLETRSTWASCDWCSRPWQGDHCSAAIQFPCLRSKTCHYLLRTTSLDPYTRQSRYLRSAAETIGDRRPSLASQSKSVRRIKKSAIRAACESSHNSAGNGDSSHG